MKKMYFFIAIIVLFCACSAEQTSTERSIERRSIDDYTHLGIMHNNIMSYANDYFQGDETITTKDEAIQYTSNWIAIHMENIANITDFAKPSWTQEFELYALNLDAKALINRLRPGETRTFKEISDKQLLHSEISLDDALVVAKKYRLIDDFECVKFREIGDKVILNADGMLSNAELKAYLLELVDEWDRQLYDKQSEQGQALGMTLAISLASLEYWEENPDIMTASTRALPIVVANDIAGATVGALSNIYISTCVNDSAIDWGSVGKSAMVGAATGSLGLVGKVGKWISRLF